MTKIKSNKYDSNKFLKSKLGSTLGFGNEASILSSIVEKTSSFVSHTDDKVTVC